ncbi:hypothetical protein MMC2321_04699 [Chitinophaga sp. MM2321]
MVSAELIRQYLAGELDDKAMHALERQALDDPFLADALEGYAMHAPDQQEHQDDLTARLAARVAPGKAVVRPMYYRRAAAAAILLLMITGGWFLLNQQNSKAPIAKMDIPPSALQDTAVSQVLSEHAAAPATNTIKPAAPELETKQVPAIAAKKDKQPAASQPEAAVDEVAPPVAANRRKIEPSLEPAPALASASPTAMKRFSADSNMAARSERETVAFSGKMANKSVMMKADVQRDEERVSPVGGFIAFEKYLHDHTVNPDNKFTGTVRISFTVMPDSSLQDIKVVNSLNAACDAEAIRVLREGPAWTPATDGKPAKATVNVLFKVKED